MSMKKKNLCLLALGIVSVIILTACSGGAADQETKEATSAEEAVAEDAATEGVAAEDTAVETKVSEDTASEEKAVQEYNINTTSVGNSNGTGSEYEISDMLPRLSDDTRIMSVEEAMELMGKNPDGTDKADDSTDADTGNQQD